VRVVNGRALKARASPGTALIQAFIVAGAVAAGPGSGQVSAHGYGAGDIQVRHPWSRATAPGATVAAGYMEIRNSGAQSDRLSGASSPAAERVELHLTVREGDIVKCRVGSALPCARVVRTSWSWA
jgi:hypothetical protein